MSDRSISYTNSYRGNQTLKKVGLSHQWTPEELDEFVKCSADPIYFAENYMKVIAPDVGTILLKLFDYQKEMILSMRDNRFTIIATSRRAGKSTAVCAFILWYVIFHSDKTVAILSNKGDTSREILGKVQFAFQFLPKWLQQGIKEWHKGSIYLENNSRVLASATSKDAIRGYQIDLLFIDEAAHIEGWKEFYTSVYPTISAGTTSKIVLVSTPKGLNHFHEIWINAEKKDENGVSLNKFNPILVTWDRVPFYTSNPNWKAETLASINFDQQQFDQEYGVSWLGSAGTLIAGWRLEQMRLEILTPLLNQNGLRKYAEPIKDHVYVMICDVSEGKALDHSAFHVIDITSMPFKQVCVFRDNITPPYDYTEIIWRTAKAYNGAAVLIENNNLGTVVVETLNYDFEYDHIIHTQSAGNQGKKVSFGFSKNFEKGIRTTKTVKAVGCSMAKLLIEQAKLEIVDHDTLEELTHFARKKDSYAADQGHDDLAMGLVLFGWLSDQAYFKDMNDINTVQRLRDRTEEQIMAELAPFGFISDGHEDMNELLDVPAKDNWMFSDEWNQ